MEPNIQSKSFVLMALFGFIIYEFIHLWYATKKGNVRHSQKSFVIRKNMQNIHFNI